MLIEAADLLVDEPDPFRWTMGVKALDLDRWLLVDEQRAADLAEVRHTLARRRDELVHQLPGSEEAVGELAALVVDHLRTHADVVEPGEPSPGDIEATRRLVQEDLCVLQREAEGWVLTACAVAAPTAWDVASKVGQSLDAIHGPVPRYDSDLVPRMGQFFDRLHVDRPVWRANRTLADSDALLIETPVRRAEPDPAVTPESVADRLWLRVEYQTLRRLPRSDAIVFTIRILRQQLSDLARRPDGAQLARQLVDGLEAIPDDVARYKNSTVMYLPQLRLWAAGL